MALLSNIKNKETNIRQTIDNLINEVIYVPNQKMKKLVKTSLGTDEESGEDCILFEFNKGFAWGYTEDIFIDVSKLEQYKFPKFIRIKPMEKNKTTYPQYALHFKGLGSGNKVLDGYTFKFGSLALPAYYISGIKKFTNCKFYGCDRRLVLVGRSSEDKSDLFPFDLMDCNKALFNSSNWFEGTAKNRTIEFMGFGGVPMIGGLDNKEDILKEYCGMRKYAGYLVFKNI